MGPKTQGSTNQGPEILRILDAIEDEEKGLFPVLFGAGKKAVEIGIGNS